MFNGIKDIQVGKIDDIIVLIKSISTLKMKSGEPYQKIIVRDREGREATFIQFDTLIQFKPPAIVQARVEAVKYGANISIKVRKCETADACGVGPESFLPKSHIEENTAWAYVVNTVKNIRPGLGRIVCSVLSENKGKFLSLPLNPAGAFARQGGILEATVKLMAVSETVAKQQELDTDLLMAAAILYYSGNFDTIDSGYNPTVTDLMYGPAAVASYKIQMKSMALASSDKDAKDEISEEDVMMLGHILTVKCNSISPAFPEAATLKYLDRMIQEVDEMNEALLHAEDEVSIHPNHFNRRLYKAKGRR